MQKLKLSISKIESCMLKKSTVFNFLYIFQLIQKVLTSNFLNLVLNIHICLYKNSKILFLLEKNNFQVKISTFFFSQTPKSKAIFGIFVPSCPKSARNKVYQIYLNFSKIQSAAMSVDVSLRSKKRITVQYSDQKCLLFVSYSFDGVVVHSFRRRMRDYLDRMAR